MDRTIADRGMDALPEVRDTVIFQEMDEGAVLYSTESEVYFGLNAVGVGVWRFLSEAGGTLEELACAIRTVFPEAPADEVLADVSEFVGELDAAGLLMRRSPTAPSA